MAFYVGYDCKDNKIKLKSGKAVKKEALFHVAGFIGFFLSFLLLFGFLTIGLSVLNEIQAPTEIQEKAFWKKRNELLGLEDNPPEELLKNFTWENKQ